MNLAFYISGIASRFNKMLNNANKELLDDIKVVFSDNEKNAYVKEKLNRLNISYILVDYKMLDGNKEQKNLQLSNELLKVLIAHEIDYCFSFGAHILKGELLYTYENRIINFHPSILPSYPGIKAIDQAIAAKAHLLGNTAHFIDDGVDTGPIIMQSVIPSMAFYEGGYDAVLDIQIEMLYKIYYLLKAGRIHVIDSKVNIDGADYSSYSILPSCN